MKRQGWGEYLLRLPLPLKLSLQESARANGRSLNAEIVQRLRASKEGYKLDRMGS